jgi:hypothetical protein
MGEQFQVDFHWLLGQVSQDPQPASTSNSLSFSNDLLPVLHYPIEGEPTHHRRWDGTYVQIPAIALPKLIAADRPYVLRFLNADVEKRLHRNDLVLISQIPNEDAEIVVVKEKTKCFLARRKNRKWFRVANGQLLASESVAVGHCVGILWSALE